MMNVQIDLSSFRLARWYEYIVRFAAGGVATVIAGLLVEKFGPVFGGLFLAFPAILPCSVTLIESHERKKKQRAGLHGTVRGKEAAGVDAAGASMGSLGMAAFAVVVWKLLPVWPAWAVFSAATIIWLAVSVLVWRHRRNPIRLLRSLPRPDLR